jgi:hypothetical protein
MTQPNPALELSSKLRDKIAEAQALTEAVRDPAEVELERKRALLAKVRVTREHALANRGTVQGLPDHLSAVWVNMNEHRQIEFQSQGYILCTLPEVKSAWKKQDGSHQRGDLILYIIEKDLREALKVDEELRALEAIAAPKHALQTAAGRLGGVIYEPTPR